MQTRRWVNQSQPQTLVIAVFLLYITAGFSLFDMVRFGVFPPLLMLIVAGQVAAGYFIANERKWGYYLGIAMAILPFVFVILYGFHGRIISLMFDIALVALLLHPQSRDYQRIWFK